MGIWKFRALQSALRHHSRRLSSNGQKNFEYDLVVIGGGSGGLACAKEASELGMKVAVLDYVEPSIHGTKWGLGGTCVNVGCIPKKLMHQAAILGESLHDARHFGWDVSETPDHSWEVMTGGIRNYIKSLNFGHMVQLRQKNVTYLNAKGKFLDRHTILAKDTRGREHQLTSNNVVISVGGRPIYPEIPGVENAISSDDIFWKQEAPGRTLVIGGSYVALECAGFLTGLGVDTSVMVRSICLRGFDQQMASLVTQYMAGTGTRFLHPSTPLHMSRSSEDAPVSVTWADSSSGEERTEEFETVMVATGRSPLTAQLDLHRAGVEVSAGGKVVGHHGGEAERSSADNVFAIGDVLEGGLELTPVAAQAGRLLARRLAGTSAEQMDYRAVPTTVFTPLEYACVGMSEEHAIEKLGEENVEVYHAYYKPLEFVVPQRDSSSCYIKAVCNRDSGVVLGLHLTGVNSGEMMQGFAVAVRLGVTYDQLTSSVGIHPTCAEEVVKLNITKRSGRDPTVTGC